MPARIFYYCGANKLPTGGNKIVYRHVEMLADAGIDAWIYHPVEAFRYQQFSPRVRIVDPATASLRVQDIFVLPEDGGAGLEVFAPGLKKIIFNQNPYYTFRGFGLALDVLPPYRHADFHGVMVVSEDSRRYIEFAFPGVACARIALSIDADRYAFVPWHRKKKQIAYMTRKNCEDVAQVVKILSSRAKIYGWQLVAIEGEPDDRVAQIMGESRIFMAFGHPEGLSLSNLEAIACGCHVIGYSGIAGREYFDVCGCVEVDVGNIVGFCRAVEAAVALDEQNTGIGQSGKTYEAAAWVAAKYSVESEIETLLDSFRFLLGDLLD